MFCLFRVRSLFFVFSYRHTRGLLSVGSGAVSIYLVLPWKCQNWPHGARLTTKSYEYSPGVQLCVLLEKGEEG